MRLPEDCVTEIVDRVVGHIDTAGECCYDTVSLGNIPAFEAVCDYVADNLERANNHREAIEGSVKEVSLETIKAAERLIDVCRWVESDKPEYKFCPWCHEPMWGSRFEAQDGSSHTIYNCINCGASCCRDPKHANEEDD